MNNRRNWVTHEFTKRKGYCQIRTDGRVLLSYNETDISCSNCDNEEEENRVFFTSYHLYLKSNFNHNKPEMQKKVLEKILLTEIVREI